METGVASKLWAFIFVLTLTFHTLCIHSVRNGYTKCEVNLILTRIYREGGGLHGNLDDSLVFSNWKLSNFVFPSSDPVLGMWDRRSDVAASWLAYSYFGETCGDDGACGGRGSEQVPGGASRWRGRMVWRGKAVLRVVQSRYRALSSVAVKLSAAMMRFQLRLTAAVGAHPSP